MTSPAAPNLRARPTRAGLAVLLLGFAAGTGGLVFSNNLLVAASALLLSLLAAAFLAGRRNLAGLSAARLLPRTIHAGASFTYRIELRRPAGGPPALQLELSDRARGEGEGREERGEGGGGREEGREGRTDGAPRVFAAALASVPAGGTAAAVVLARFLRRGRKRFPGVTLSSRYPLGLFTVRCFLPLAEEATVYPRLLPVPEAWLPKRRCERHVGLRPEVQARFDEEFSGLRDFRPGDNPKRIYWKSLARCDGRLLVREYDSPAVREATVLLDARVDAGDRRARRRFDRAVSRAASLVRELVRRRFRVTFRLLGHPDDTPRTVQDDAGLARLFRLLALVSAVEAEERAQREAEPVLSGRFRQTAPRALVSAGPGEEVAWL